MSVLHSGQTVLFYIAFGSHRKTVFKRARPSVFYFKKKHLDIKNRSLTMLFADVPFGFSSLTETFHRVATTAMKPL